MSFNNISILAYINLLNSFSFQSNSLESTSIQLPAYIDTSANPIESNITLPQLTKIPSNLFDPLCFDNTEGKKSIPPTQNKNIKTPLHKPLKRNCSEVTEKCSQKHVSKVSSDFNLETELVEVDSAETDFHSPLHIGQIQKPCVIALSNTILSSASNFNQAPTPKLEIDFLQELQEIANALGMNHHQQPSKKIKMNDSFQIKMVPVEQNQPLKKTKITKKQNKINIKQSKKHKQVIENQSNQSQEQSNSPAINLTKDQEIQNNNSLKIKKNRQSNTKCQSQSQNKQLKKQSHQQQPQKLVFAEEVYLKTLSEEGSIKLLKFPCFKESDLNIPAQHSQLIQHYSDDDKCSDDDLLEKAVNFLHKKLVASTLEMNPQAKIVDSDKIFTINDIKIDRESEEEDEDNEDDENEQYCSSNNYQFNSQRYRQNSNYSKKGHNEYLSEEDDSDNDDEQCINSFSK